MDRQVMLSVERPGQRRRGLWCVGGEAHGGVPGDGEGAADGRHSSFQHTSSLSVSFTLPPPSLPAQRRSAAWGGESSQPADRSHVSSGCQLLCWTGGDGAGVTVPHLGAQPAGGMFPSRANGMVHIGDLELDLGGWVGFGPKRRGAEKGDRERGNQVCWAI